jgi:hypothetical protein
MTTPVDDEGEELNPVDQEALERAIEICRTQKAPADRTQIEHKLETEPWVDVGTFASYSCQVDSLHLKPWQPPPCWVDDVVADINAGNDGVGGQYQAAKLLQRMLDAGLSRYEPDPLKALEKAKKKLPPAA